MAIAEQLGMLNMRTQGTDENVVLKLNLLLKNSCFKNCRKNKVEIKVYAKNGIASK